MATCIFFINEQPADTITSTVLRAEFNMLKFRKSGASTVVYEIQANFIFNQDIDEYYACLF